MSMTIYIPSRGRATRLLTPQQLPRRWQERTFLVVPEDEVDEYARHAVGHFEILGIGPEYDGIHATRQFILDHCDTSKVFMIDDDMTFCRRVPDWDKDLKAELIVPSNRPPVEVGELMDMMSEWLDEIPVVSISARQGNQNIRNRWFREVTRMNNVYGFYLPLMRELDIRFDRLEVMEDFDVTLNYLTRGYKNRVMTDWCWNQRGSGKKGGCSSYRTAELQASCAHKLKELYPDFVTIVEKETPATSGLWDGMRVRTDVRIQWRQAYTGTDPIEGDDD